MRSNLSIILRRLARSHRDATLLLRCGRPIRPYIGVRHMRLTRVFARHRRVRRAGPTRLPDLERSVLRSVATSMSQIALEFHRLITSLVGDQARQRRALLPRQRRAGIRRPTSSWDGFIRATRKRTSLIRRPARLDDPTAKCQIAPNRAWQ